LNKCIGISSLIKYECVKKAWIEAISPAINIEEPFMVVIFMFFFLCVNSFNITHPYKDKNVANNKDRSGKLIKKSFFSWLLYFSKLSFL